MMTLGSSPTPVFSHCSAMLARYCRSSLADLWSTLKVATEPAVSSLPDLGKEKYTYICETFVTVRDSRIHAELIKQLAPVYFCLFKRF